MFGKTESTAANDSNKKPLLSHSTILILSGIVVGIAAGKAVHPDIQNYVLLAGVGGLMAYIGLDSVAKQRKHRMAKAAHDRATQALEERYSRHLAANEMKVESTPRRPVSTTIDQYVTVPRGTLQSPVTRHQPRR